MKSLNEWPLDGVSVFLAIIAILAAIIIVPYFDKSSKAATIRPDGVALMRPSFLGNVYTVAFLGFCVVLTIILSKTGQCSKMTDAENLENQRIGYLVTGCFWLGSLWYCYAQYMPRYSFDWNKIRVKTPFSEKTYLWSYFKGFGYNIKGGYYDFGIQGKFYVPNYHNGVMQLNALAASHLIDLKSPITQAADDEHLALLRDKTVRVYILGMGADYSRKIHEMFCATIISAERDFIIMRKDNGEEFKVLSNLNSFCPAMDFEPWVWDIDPFSEAEETDFIALFHSKQ